MGLMQKRITRPTQLQNENSMVCLCFQFMNIKVKMCGRAEYHAKSDYHNTVTIIGTIILITVFII